LAIVPAAPTSLRDPSTPNWIFTKRNGSCLVGLPVRVATRRWSILASTYAWPFIVKVLATEERRIA
jgi:hypothetical protein